MELVELVFITSVTLVLPYMILRFAKNMRRMKLDEQRLQKLPAPEQEALPLRELQGLIREAVVSANAPLEARIRELEAERRQLPAAPEPTGDDARKAS